MKRTVMGANLQELDLNLLRVFDALRVEGSVSGAARRLRITQPGASRALARLRDALGDPLFLPAPGGLLLTPYAERVADHVRDALALLTAGIARADFDPARSERRFAIWMSDYSEVVLLPAVCRRLAAEAPGVRVELVGQPVDVARALADGDLDLGIVAAAPDGPRTLTRRLLRDELVAAARVDHPVFSQGPLAPDDGAGWRIRYSAIQVRSRSLLATALLVAQTDQITTLPRLLAVTLERRGILRVLPGPVEPGGFDLRMRWHERLQADDGHRWLRDVIREAASEVEAAGSEDAERADAAAVARNSATTESRGAPRSSIEIGSHALSSWRV